MDEINICTRRASRFPLSSTRDEKGEDGSKARRIRLLSRKEKVETNDNIHECKDTRAFGGESSETAKSFASEERALRFPP